MPISKTVLAYTQKATHTALAVKHFEEWTERGIKPPVYLVDQEDNIDLADLMFAHSVSARTPHRLLEGEWINGMEDYPLGVLLIDFLRQDRETFLRRLPVYERAYRLHARCGGRL